MFAGIAENIKLIASCLTGVGAVCGGYIALDGPIPASQQYVVAQNEGLRGRVIDGQLQLNTVQRNLLKKEKFDRELQLPESPPAVKQILQQRIDAIHEELEVIDSQRESLRKEKLPK